MVEDAVKIAVFLGQSFKAVFTQPSAIFDRIAAEQLPAIVDEAVTIAVKNQKSIIGIKSPSQVAAAVTIMIK